MYTPRPDRFTYPIHGDPLGGSPAAKVRMGIPGQPWMRAVFIGSLVAAFGLGMALSLAA